MKYSQYPYKRIDLEEFKKEVEVMIKDFKSAESVDNQIKIIQEYQKIQKETQTFATTQRHLYSKYENILSVFQK